jgi:hypothetical protein
VASGGDNREHLRCDAGGRGPSKDGAQKVWVVPLPSCSPPMLAYGPCFQHLALMPCVLVDAESREEVRRLAEQLHGT